MRTIFLKSTFLSAFFIFYIFIYLDALEIEAPKQNENLKRNYENNFLTNIFDSYENQLTEHSKVLNLPPDLENILIHPVDSPDEKRAKHESIVNLLRSFITDNKNNPINVVEDINEFSFILYTKTHVLPEMYNFIASSIDWVDESISTQSFSKVLHDSYIGLKSAPQFGGHYKVNPEIVDLHLEGFLPSYLYTAHGSDYLFLPRPLIENKVTKEESINPIFLSYLRHVKRLNKKHLYINVSSRNNLLESLAKTEEFKNTFHIITMDRTSDFYWQENEWQNQNNASEFIQDFKKAIVLGERFHWPEIILEKNWIETASAILDLVHKSYFHSDSLLNDTERMAFIDIALVKLSEAAKQIISPDFINISCAYTNDRGPSQFSLEYVYNMLKENGKFDEKNKRDLLAMVFGPPLTSHNRPTHDYRLDRLSMAMDLLTNPKE